MMVRICGIRARCVGGQFAYACYAHTRAIRTCVLCADESISRRQVVRVCGLCAYAGLSHTRAVCTRKLRSYEAIRTCGLCAHKDHSRTRAVRMRARRILGPFAREGRPHRQVTRISWPFSYTHYSHMRLYVGYYLIYVIHTWAC
jgi:hypothetical protein